MAFNRSCKWTKLDGIGLIWTGCEKFDLVFGTIGLGIGLVGFRLLVCLSLFWFNLVCFGLFWFVLVCFGLFWFVLVCFGVIWFVLVCFGLFWLGLVGFGLFSLFGLF